MVKEFEGKIEEKIGKKFAGIEPFEKKIWLSSPTMHGKEMEYMQEAYDSNWMSTVGENIDELERLVAEKVGVKYAVGLTCGTALWQFQRYQYSVRTGAGRSVERDSGVLLGHDF